MPLENQQKNHLTNPNTVCLHTSITFPTFLGTIPTGAMEQSTLDSASSNFWGILEPIILTDQHNNKQLTG
jgi:hypothetical protein